MSIYDKLIGCVPVNKTAAVVVGLEAQDFEPTTPEKRLKQIGEEIKQINATLSSIKNNNFIGIKERDEIVKRKNELEAEAKKLKRPDGILGEFAFQNVFFKLCRQKLPRETFNELYNSAKDIINYAKDYIIKNKYANEDLERDYKQHHFNKTISSYPKPYKDELE